MRPALGVVLLTLLAAGCALNRPPNSSYGVEAARYTPPLEADIWADPQAGVSYMVNRPAYVAIFEISPYNGVAMLYPAYQGDEQRTYGTRYVVPSALNTSRWAYESSLGFYTSARNPVTRSWYGPHYLMIIASERPLAVSQFRQRPFALRQAMGYESFLARQPFEAMNQVVNMVLPQPVGGDWATNVYAVWPQEQNQQQQRFVTIQCGGTLLTVPWALVYQAAQLCAVQQQQIAQNDSTGGRGSSPSASGVRSYPVEAGATESMPGVRSGRRHGGASTQTMSGGNVRAGPPPGRPNSVDRGQANTRPSAPPRVAPRPRPAPMPVSRPAPPPVTQSAPPPPRPHHGSSHGHGTL